MTKRILVVEDEFLIAFDIKVQLEDAGFTVSGPAGTVEDAFAELDHAQVFAAILDMNLHGESSFPVADRLEAEGIPFLFLSGNDASQLPPRFEGRIVHTKPVMIRELVRELKGLGGD